MRNEIRVSRNQRTIVAVALSRRLLSACRCSDLSVFYPWTTDLIQSLVIFIQLNNACLERAGKSGILIVIVMNKKIPVLTMDSDSSTNKYWPKFPSG
jgi:hypothetical protein